MLTYAYEGFDPRGYLTVQLTQPLQQGAEYCFGLYASLADHSAFKTASLGLMLHPSLPTICNGEDSIYWPGEEYLVLNSLPVDTGSWSYLSGSFTASGGELFLTVGNFVTLTNPDTAFISWSQGPPYATLYYFDDAYLGPCNVGLSESGMDQLISVYPNPVQSGTPITLQISRTGEPLSVKIFDPQSRLVSAYRFAHPTEAIELLPPALVPGVYTISIDQKGQLRQVRLVVY